MHRTNHVLRLIGGSSLLFGWMLFSAIDTASAQLPMPGMPGMPGMPAKAEENSVIAMTAGGSQFYFSKEFLKSVVNPAAKVLRVSQVDGDPKKLLFEALTPGRTRVTLVDVNGRTEYVDVVVVSDRVAELRNLIKHCVPTASVNVCPTDSGSAVVLAGFVSNTDDARAVQQVAGQLFGVNVVNNVRIGGVQQVQVEVIVAVVNRSEARNMSFSWVENGPNWFVSSFFGAPLSFMSTLAPQTGSGFNSNLASTGAANIPFGILNSKSSFMGFLQALRVEGLTKIHAEPRVITLSGQTGQIVSGGESPIITASTGGSNVTYKQFGTVVTFLPIVLGNGKIHLDINAEVSAIDTATSVNIASAGSVAVAPGFKTRRAQAKVQIEDGQTLAIGGLIQNTVAGNISRVPVLGDLPFLGTLFTNKSYTETEEELIILVTPRLVDGIDCTKFPHFLPGRKRRSPDDFEFFLEGIMEAPRGQRNVGLNPFTYRAAHTLPGANPRYPCGDASGCYGRGGNCASGACGVPSPYPISYPSATGPSSMNNVSSTRTEVAMPPSRMPQQIAPVTFRVQGESEIPMNMPAGRDTPPQLGPVVSPMTPPIPARDMESRSVLPVGALGANTR